MTRVPDSIRPQFLVAGWHPGRKVPISASVPRDHPAADILAEFGGLTVEPSEDGGPFPITFRELWPDESILRGWAQLLNVRLVGIAHLDDHHGEFYAASDGRIFGRSCMHDAFWFEGDSFSEAVERALMGERGQPMLRPDQSWVTFYGVRFTTESPQIYRYR